MKLTYTANFGKVMVNRVVHGFPTLESKSTGKKVWYAEVQVVNLLHDPPLVSSSMNLESQGVLDLTGDIELHASAWQFFKAFLFHRPIITVITKLPNDEVQP